MTQHKTNQRCFAVTTVAFQIYQVSCCNLTSEDVLQCATLSWNGTHLRQIFAAYRQLPELSNHLSAPERPHPSQQHLCCLSFLLVLDPRLLQWLLIARSNSSFVWQVFTYNNVGKSVVSWQLLSSWSVSCFRFYVGFFVWYIELVVLSNSVRNIVHHSACAFTECKRNQE